MYCISVTLYILGCDMGEVGAMSSRRRGVMNIIIEYSANTLP
jgi:hypothetical protein